MKIGQHEIHPIADLFPMMTNSELSELQKDIKQNGLTLPVTLLDDKILDGRNRYLACEKAGIVPSFAEFDGKDPVQFVVSSNMHRRHLTTKQRAQIAAKIATMTEGSQPTASNEAVVTNSPPRVSQTQAAKMMGVSRASVQRAKAASNPKPARKKEPRRKGTFVEWKTFQKAAERVFAGLDEMKKLKVDQDHIFPLRNLLGKMGKIIESIKENN